MRYIVPTSIYREPRAHRSLSPPAISRGLCVRLLVLAAYLLTLASYLGTGELWLLYLSNGFAFVVAIANLLETRDLFHPFSMIPCVHGMYSVLPLLSPVADSTGETLVDVFGSEGGGVIFSAATLGIILSWGADCLLVSPVKLPPTGRPKPSVAIPEPVPWIVFATGTVLTAAFFAKVGFGDLLVHDYLEKFQIRLTPGMGIFTYGITLLTLSLPLFLSQPTINVKGLVACGCAFAILFAAFAERKYLVIPILMLIASYQYRVPRLPKLATIGVCAVLYVFFEFIGYVRVVTDGGLYPGARVSFEDFLSSFAGHIGWGEMASIYGTASAAYTNFIDALPRLGDYLQSWEMAIPQFLVVPDYLPANDRFALAYDAARAFDRMGWGFSVFGEAYLVMGLAGPAIVAIALTTLTVRIYRMAWRNNFQGLAGSIWFSLIYYQLWVQRNALAHFLKDWVIYQMLPLFLIVLAGNLASARLAGRSARRRMPARVQQQV